MKLPIYMKVVLAALALAAISLSILNIMKIAEETETKRWQMAAVELRYVTYDVDQDKPTNHRVTTPDDLKKAIAQLPLK